MPSITPDNSEFDWSSSLSAEDAKYWRQEEVHRINQTGEMNITPMTHTNEGESSGWTIVLTPKRQPMQVLRSILFYVLDIALLAGVILVSSTLIGIIESALGIKK